MFPPLKTSTAKSNLSRNQTKPKSLNILSLEGVKEGCNAFAKEMGASNYKTSLVKIKKLSLMLTILTFSICQAQDKVYVNEQKVPISKLKAIKSYYGITIGNGKYWYDSRCGAWGFENGPTQGFIPARLKLGGYLKSTASNGKTNVFVNGRELPLADVRALQRIINVVPGRFWLDDKGNGGYMGMVSTFNLVHLARRKGRSSFYRNSYTGIGAGSSGGTSYVMGKDWSVIID